MNGTETPAILASKASPAPNGKDRWVCRVPGCDHVAETWFAAMFHQHEAHGTSCQTLVVSGDNVFCEGNGHDIVAPSVKSA